LMRFRPQDDPPAKPTKRHYPRGQCGSQLLWPASLDWAFAENCPGACQPQMWHTGRNRSSGTTSIIARPAWAATLRLAIRTRRKEKYAAILSVDIGILLVS